jgi:hypothetical protein
MKNIINKKDNTSNKNKKFTLKTPIIFISKGKPLNDVEKKTHWNAGIYFIYGKKGYLSTGCPEKKKPIANIEKSSKDDQVNEAFSSDSENWRDRWKSFR